VIAFGIVLPGGRDQVFLTDADAKVAFLAQLRINFNICLQNYPTWKKNALDLAKLRDIVNEFIKKRMIKADFSLQDW
jgi:hypothetical protein